jgi:hypothetical protein
MWKDKTWDSDAGFEFPKEEVIAWCNIPKMPSDFKKFNE